MTHAINSSAPAPICVLFCDKSLSGGLLDRLQGRRELDGAELHCTLGEVGQQTVACAWPKANHSDWARLIHALIAAHQPKLLVCAGPALPLSDSESLPGIHRIGRVILESGDSLEFIPASNGATITVAHPQATSTEAHCNWASDCAVACAEAGLPAVAFAVITEHPREPDWAHLNRQATVVGKLGAALGSVWRRPVFAKEAWNRMRCHFKVQAELADRILNFLATHNPESPPPNPRPTNHGQH